MTPIAPDVWHVPVEPLKYLGGIMRMPLASTVLRLPDGKVLIYAPGKFDDEQLSAIDALGEVAYIVAPNLFHHLYVTRSIEKWPNAKVLGAPGLGAKRKDLTFHGEPVSVGDAIEVELIGGQPKLNEAVLFHRPTGTLVCADFLFNVTKPHNVLTKLVLKAAGVGGGKLGMSTMLWKVGTKDRDALRKSIDRVMTWPIQHVAPSHGEAADANRDHLAPLFAKAYGSVPVAQ